MPLLAIAAVALVASAGVSAYGAYSSGQAQSDAANFNAKVAANNAGAAAQQAKFDANQISDETKRNVAMQRAAMAASGFDANSGTFTDVTTNTKRSGELNRLARIYMGRLGINQQRSQSQLYSAESGYASKAGYVGATSSILGGVSGAASLASNPSFQS